jgi:hypothetical protein
MKLKKGEQIHISNWIMKNHSQSPNSGFVSRNKKEEPESKIIEYPGAWLVVAPASVAFNNEVCNYCQRIYRFNHLGARAQCECRGQEQ